MKRLIRLLCAVAALLVAVHVNADSSDAIIRLLNSQASGSVRAFTQAAEEVAVEARKGRSVYAYVLAVISRTPSPPPAARLDEATRKRWLDGCRAKIEKLAHEKNNSMAWYLLSLEKDDLDLLRRAAEAGNVQAMNGWGNYLLTRAVSETSNRGEVNRMLGVAFDYFKNAADQGDANGIYNVGMCYQHGLGIPKDDKKAFDCFCRAAEKEHPAAINNIGRFFREGRVVPKDLEMSAQWFEKSASYDNAYGLLNFALALQKGEGVAQDEARAVQLLAKAADGGCVEAIDAYGVALWKGRGVKKDPEAAVRLFLRAAEADYPPAMENLSTCYRYGTGVKADERESLEWKRRASAARGRMGGLR